jgi:sulfide dehydrogenase cytochrome subunit
MAFTKTRTLSKIHLALAAMLAAAAPAGAADAVDPALLADSCAACHGTGGSSVGGAPTISNLTVDYFVLAMKDYASGARPATVMNRIAKGYTEAEIAAMAQYFDKQPFVRYVQTTDAKVIEQGKALQAKYCQANCHEAEGRKSDGIGVLAGQRFTYLANSVEDFRSGKRVAERRKKQRMDEMVSEAGEGGFNAILNFYASQK